MAYPTVDNAHADEAVALLTDHYRTKITVPKLLRVLVAPFQELEGVFWDLINKFLLANSPTGDQLNAIGSIVGAQRGALSDADYLAEVILQIRTNRSNGVCNDVIDIATLALRGAGIATYLDMPPAQFLVEAFNLPSPNVVAELLSDARATATRGILHYSQWAPGNDFEFTSRYGGAAGEGNWGSRYSSSTGGLLVAAAQV